MSDMTARVAKAIDCWNAGDLAGYLTLYDPAIRLHGYSPEPMNKEAVRAFYQSIFDALGETGRPNPKLGLHETLSDGDLYSCRFTMSGVHRGTFMGVPATNRSYVLPGITIMRCAGNTVVERWSSADMLGLLVQVGAVPPPG